MRQRYSVIPFLAARRGPGLRCWSTALLAVGLLTSAVRMTSAISDPALQQELKVTRALFDAGRFEEAYHHSEELLQQAESSTGADSLETAEVLDLLVRAQSRTSAVSSESA